MRIAIFAGGGRGDTQPYVALAQGFIRAGHRPTVFTQPEWAPLCEQGGVACRTMDIDMNGLIESDDFKRLVGSGRNPLTFLRAFGRMLEPLAERAAAELIAGMRDCDAAVAGSMSMLTGTADLERFGQPYGCAYPMPVTPSAEFASIMLPPWPGWLPVGRRLYHRLSHWLFARLTGLIFGPMMKRMLRVLPPPPPRTASGPPPVLYGYSPQMLPRPADWPAHVHVTGYWFLDAPSGWQPPPALIDFLDAGPAPVYVGFGSMRDRDPAATTAIVLQALEQAHLRAVVTSGWGGIDRGALPDFVYAADAIPHDWLFPHVAAVVHHGGAGTTAAGLRAGVPSVLIPHMGDQPFWGRRVHALGAGPAPIPRKKLTVDGLAAALNQAVVDPELRTRAQALGEHIRAERGVENAVAIAVAHFERALR